MSEEIRSTVTSMLAELDSRGLEAVRHFSGELDDWTPASFVIEEDEFERAAASLDPDCATTSPSRSGRSGASPRLNGPP